MRIHILLTILLVATALHAQAPAERRISLDEYRQKMKAGWIGQMAGVALGAPTEFRSRGTIMAADAMPAWRPAMINDSFGQDDLYVEMTFLRTLEQHGLQVSSKQAGIDFANSGYPLWHANAAGRKNLRAGIAPPDSGHPKFNAHADDIDYQIEADFSGLVAPGLPNTAIALGEKFGRLMNYGDGLYAGQFMGGLYAEAFFETDPEKIIRAGLACIPAQSQYAQAIRDVLAWHKDIPDDWTKAWAKIDEKYQKNPDYRRASCDKKAFNIDAKINGAYVAMGLLYGGGDPDRTIAIACRCGQDSDCNPSSAAGVLFTALGMTNVPDRFYKELDEKRLWSHTDYDFPRLLAACEKVAREAVAQSGGRVEKDAAGREWFVIPTRQANPSPLEQCWQPAPPANSRYSEEESVRIKQRQK